MVAALFSATASMVSPQLNVFAGVLTNDFYRPLVNPYADEKTLVFVGRFFMALIGGLLILMALLIPAMGGAEKVIITFNSMLVVPLLAPTLWGVFSRKIGTLQMLIVAFTSFSIGIFLRFGMPWLTQEGDTFWFVTEYVLNHKKLVELFNGVLLPVCMLAIFELTLRAQDTGADKLAAKCNASLATITATASVHAFDPYPAKMVMFSLLLLGSWILLIGSREPGQRMVLVSTGFALLIVGFAIGVFLRRHRSRLP